MTNRVSVWEDNFRQPEDENITNELSRLSTQVATTNAKAVALEPVSTTLTLVNGWLNFGSAFASASAVRQGRLVQVVGLIRLGTTTAGTVLTTLPVGWRPSSNIVCTCWCQNGTARVDVNSTGQVVLGGELTAGANPATYLSLNLSFFTS
jgi:hypothetical protein